MLILKCSNLRYCFNNSFVHKAYSKFIRLRRVGPRGTTGMSNHLKGDTSGLRYHRCHFKVELGYQIKTATE